MAALLLGAAAYAIAEERTLTTYYPSPRGVYKELRTTDNTFLAMEGGSVGIGTITPAQKLQVEGGVQIGDTAVDTTGTLRFNGTNFQGRDAAAWKNLMMLPTSSNVKMEYVSGYSNCPAGSGNIVMRRWNPATCTDPQGCGSCTTGEGWSASAHTCTYPVWQNEGEGGSCSGSLTCTSGTWSEAVCLGN